VDNSLASFILGSTTFTCAESIAGGREVKGEIKATLVSLYN
jgi:hypothetical protein